jgi:SAM-dependent methyltransferase
MCLQIDQIPSDISRYYPSDYYSLSLNTQIIKRIERQLLILRDQYAFSRKGFVGRMVYSFFPSPAMSHISSIKVAANAKILDVGCGTGHHLIALYRQGYKNLIGIDPFLDQDLEINKELKIYKKAIDEMDGRFDLIMFHHTLEHMPNQFSTFQAISRLLAIDGLCLIRIPTVTSHAWEKYRINWASIDAPRHFFLHSHKSIRFLAQLVNLSVTEIKGDSTEFQFWASEQYTNDIPLMSSKSILKNPFKLILMRSQIESWRQKAHLLNRQGRGDQVAIFIKKNNLESE